jgi:hypothetical protein
MDSKQCSKCGELKPLEDFSRNRGRKDGRKTWCYACGKTYRATNSEVVKARKRAYRANNSEALKAYDRAYRTTRAIDRPFLGMCESAVKSRIDKGVDDLITPNYLEDLYRSQGSRCAYTGKVMHLDYLALPYHPYAPSVDRLDNELPHTKANTVLIRRWINFSRRQADLGLFLSYLDDEVAPGFIRPQRVLDYLSTLRSDAA